MTTILEVFGCIEIVILLFGFLSLLWWKEMESLLSLAVIIYGSGINALAFLVAIAVHDHVHISIGTK